MVSCLKDTYGGVFFFSTQGQILRSSSKVSRSQGLRLICMGPRPHLMPFLAVDPLAILGCSVGIHLILNMSTLMVAVVSFHGVPHPFSWVSGDAGR